MAASSLASLLVTSSKLTGSFTVLLLCLVVHLANRQKGLYSKMPNSKSTFEWHLACDLYLVMTELGFKVVH